MTLRIVTDSTCDLPAATITRYGIRVVPLYINVGNQGYLAVPLPHGGGLS
jgi:fatty acid-binding protein DegV